ncbi:MAG: hypothetical protein LBH22_06500 [Bacteroidales bacterium]|jgi:hypothetical protein|nr:hypothetical protein [Bacteroidales bacterium]
MKTMKINYKIVLIWALVCAVLYFFCESIILGKTLYVFITLPLATYLFPIMAVIGIVHEYKRDKSIKTMVSLGLSYFVMSSILVFSAVLLYLPDNNIIITTQSILLIANAVLAFYNLLIRDDKDIAFLHIMFGLFGGKV